MKDGIELTKQFGVRELRIIKSIAETIYRSNDLPTLLNAVLRDIVKLTEMEVGWIFLTDEIRNQYTCPAHYQLPKSLSMDKCKALTTGSCWCLDEYWKGQLTAPVNVNCCQRLNQKMDYVYGDMEGITHHATIPIIASSGKFGILNVAVKNKVYFTEEELMLMESIAFRIGVALEKNRKYQSELKRSDLFSKLSYLTRDLGKLLITEQIPDIVVSWIGEHLGCDHASFYIEENGKLSHRVSWEEGVTTLDNRIFLFNQLEQIDEAFISGETKEWNNQTKVDEYSDAYSKVRYSLAVPLMFRGTPFGVIYVSFVSGQTYDKVEAEVIELLSVHITLAFENARLYQQQMDLLKWEERNRLARDLHDSVSQMLFSLQFTAGGLETVLDNPSEMVQHMINDMRQLTQNALTEMRSLILQLRPIGLEQGLMTGLFHYGKAQGLVIKNCVECVLELPNLVEESLFRIGQEALNNARKYAGHPIVQISLKELKGQVILEIKDNGDGFSQRKVNGLSTLGMRTMRERAETLGGTLEVDSRVGEGTTIRAMIPLFS